MTKNIISRQIKMGKNFVKNKTIWLWVRLKHQYCIDNKSLCIYNLTNEKNIKKYYDPTMTRRVDWWEPIREKVPRLEVLSGDINWRPPLSWNVDYVIIAMITN